MDIATSVVKAFTARGAGGNPAGIVLHADKLSDAQMLSIAKSVGFSETAFVSSSTKATHKVRFFTPTEEVDLCGHATIATWSLLSQRNTQSAGNYTQETLAGILGIRIDANGLVFMEHAPARFFEEVPSQEVAALLGIKSGDLHDGLPSQIVSTGLKDIMVVVKDQQVLANLEPNLTAIAEASKKYDVTGFHVFCLLDGDESLAAARNFAPFVGIPEESATGTSNGALLCYLRDHQALPARAMYRIEQGKAMQQLSYIYGTLENDRVWIGGVATYINDLNMRI
jgi:PhzF family phenazine biosynthesis protein